MIRHALHPVSRAARHAELRGGFPRCLRLEELEADVALIGVPYKSPYDGSVPARHGEGTIPDPGAAAAAALSRQSQAYAHSLRHHDYDFGGDLVMDAADYRVNLQAIREAVGLILQRGAGEGHADAGGRQAL